MDISATVLDRAKVAPYNGLQGKSMLPVAAEPTSAGPRDAVLIEEDNQRILPVLGKDPKARTLITKNWRLSVYYGQNWGELYDLENDPGELNNLWDDTECQNTKMAMMERLVHEQIALNDNSPQPLGRA
jgi:arylsulfatase A-like enzyme